MGEGCGVCAGIILSIGAFLIILLVPLSFSKVEFYQSGLVTQKSTGQVDRSNVYGTGNHFIGPDYTFRTFVTSANFYSSELSAWTASNDEDAGSTVTMGINFQYILRKGNLGELYNKVALNYNPLILAKTTDAIKNTAPLFSVDDFLSNRAGISEVFRANISNAINEVYADIIGFQLNMIGFEDEYRSSRLNAAIQIESNALEDYVQEATIVRASTGVDVLRIENNASRILAQAEADAQFIVAESEYEATATVENARNNGLKLLFDELSLETEAHKASLDYILTLMKKETGTAKHYVNFLNAKMQFPIG